MSLQGTLETIPLPDVLALLAATKKSGELRITGARGDGRLWLDAGMVVEADVPRASTPVDAVFELLRLTSGSFAFSAGTAAAKPGKPLAVEAVLAEAQERLAMWKAIEAVVPSMACSLRLTPELSFDTVTVSRQQWKELVSVAGGGDVNGAMKSLGCTEYEACRIVKGLVDAGLVQVGKAPVPVPDPVPEPAPEPVRASTPTPAPAVRRDPPAVRAEQARSEAAALVRRPAPTPGPVRPAGSPPVHGAPTPGRVPAAALSSSPASATTNGRSVATRRPGQTAAQVAAPEDAKEGVQRLATLGKAHASPEPARAGSGSADGDAGGGASPAPVAGTPGDEGSADANGDEPINRGMLLKFLSSVRP